MADDPKNIHWLQVGSASTPDGTPGTWYDVAVEGGVTESGPATEKYPVQGQTDDGQHTASQQGTVNASLSFQTLLRTQGSAAGDTVTPAAPTDLGVLIGSFFGGATMNGEGRTISDASPTTTQLDLSVADDLSDGTSQPPLAFIFTTASNGYQAREAIQDTGSTVDLDRALGSAPANGSTCCGMTDIVLDADDTEHDYTFFRSETKQRRYDYDGCALQCKITVPPKGLVTVDWTVMATDASRETKASPTFSSSNKGIGNGIEGQGSEFYIGATKVPLAGTVSINFNLVPKPRVYNEGTNGTYGHVWILDSEPTIDFEIYQSTTHEDNFRGASVYDLALQCGNPSKAATTYKCAYWRFPAAQGVTVGEGEVNGLRTHKIQCKCTRHATGNVHMHLGGAA